MNTKGNHYHQYDKMITPREMNLELRARLNGQDKRAQKPAVICFSHLRWDFVYQRPQHLLSRCARERRVFFFEEPVFHHGSLHLEVRENDENIHVVVPHFPHGLESDVAIRAILKEMVHRLIHEQAIEDYVLWYYTPMALSFTQHLTPLATVYDCMDELSAFKNAPRLLRELETELFRKADLVFTGGQSLYEAKRNSHHSVHAFPSSIDFAHFKQARNIQQEPSDQQQIGHPRLGFFGVIDERFDIALLDQLASQRPEWHFVMIGPVVKIDESSLPRHPNIHYLGGKQYRELPAYIAGWDVALLLFAMNDATRFISPTKTPEYLAAAKPVVSTPIRDVVRPYGDLGLVQIASDADGFVKAIETVLNAENTSEWLKKADDFLSHMSWDQTWSRMWRLIDEVLEQRRSVERPTVAAISTETNSAAAAL